MAQQHAKPLYLVKSSKTLSMGRKSVHRKHFYKCRVTEVGYERAAAPTLPSPSPPPLQHICQEGWKPAPPASHAHLRDMQAPGGSGHPGSPSCPTRAQSQPTALLSQWEQRLCGRCTLLCSHCLLLPMHLPHTWTHISTQDLLSEPHGLQSATSLLCPPVHSAAECCPAFLGCSQIATCCASGSLLLSFSRQNSYVSQLLTAV